MEAGHDARTALFVGSGQDPARRPAWSPVPEGNGEVPGPRVLVLGTDAGWAHSFGAIVTRVMGSTRVNVQAIGGQDANVDTLALVTRSGPFDVAIVRAGDEGMLSRVRSTLICRSVIRVASIFDPLGDVSSGSEGQPDIFELAAPFPADLLSLVIHRMSRA